MSAALATDVGRVTAASSARSAALPANSALRVAASRRSEDVLEPGAAVEPPEKEIADVLSGSSAV
jgi:hypothetical protein